MISRLNLGILLGALLGLALALFSQSARLLKQFEAPNVAIQYAQGSPLSGRAFVRINNQWQPLWLDLTWRWCPRLNPVSWCVSAQGDIGEAHGQASLGFNSVKLSDVQLSGDSISLLIAGFIETSSTIDANISHLVLRKGEPLEAIESLQATLLLSDLYGMGVGFAAHRISVERAAESDFRVVIKGEQANGNITATGVGEYKADLLLTPPAPLAHLFKQQLPEAPIGTFHLERSGSMAELR